MLKSSWHKGIRSMVYNQKQSYYEVKLHGKPWSSYFTFSSESLYTITGVTHSARLQMGLCQLMCAEGWIVEIAMQHAGKFGNIHDALYFTKAKEKAEHYPPMCCIAFGKCDKIRVVDGPPEVLKAVDSEIKRHLEGGLQKRRSFGSTEEFELVGMPLMSGGVSIDIFLSQLILALMRVGWRIYTKIELRPCTRFGRWILKKDVDSAIEVSDTIVAGSKDSIQSASLKGSTDVEFEAFCTGCCITFTGSSNVRLSNTAPNLWVPFQETMKVSWHNGIRSMIDNQKRNYFAVKLHSEPCSSPFTFSLESLKTVPGLIHLARLHMGLCQYMLAEGWIVDISVENYGDAYSYYNALYFRKANEKTEQYPSMCCIAFGWSDLITVIDGPPEVLKAVKSNINQHWKKGLQKHRSFGSTEEFKLVGIPLVDGGICVGIFLSLLKLDLRKVGWRIYSEVELRPSTSFGRWILKKDVISVVEV